MTTEKELEGKLCGAKPHAWIKSAHGVVVCAASFLAFAFACPQAIAKNVAKQKPQGACLPGDVSRDRRFKYPRISVKTGNYSPKSGQTRRQFIENTFGVKFGEGLPKHIKVDGNEAASGIAVRRLSMPICGRNRASLIFKNGGKLSGLNLMPATDAAAEKTADAAQGVAAAMAKAACKAVEKWLGAARLENNERKFECVYVGSKPVSASLLEDGDVSVAVDAFIFENEDAGTWSPYCQILIDYKPISSDTKKRLEEIFLPSMSFRPPNTVKDAFELFQKAVAESGGSDTAGNRQGIDFVVDKDVGGVMIPSVSTGRISLYEAVKLVCDVVCCDFEISNGKVVVKSRN